MATETSDTMQYLRIPKVGDRKQFRYLIAILMLLTACIGGQFILSDPLKVLAPEVSMLSSADWPSSQYNLELLITDGRPWSG